MADSLDDYESRFSKLESELDALRSEFKPDTTATAAMDTTTSDSNNNNNNRNGNGNGNKRQRTSGPHGGNGRVKWVSADKDDARNVGRFITGAALPDAVVGFPVTLHAKYDKPTNTALKACAIALTNCANDYKMYVACTLTFRENRNELTVKCCRLTGGDNGASVYSQQEALEPNESDKLHVGRKTDFKNLAGAIANMIRSDNKGTPEDPVIVAAVGPECAFIAARAIATCRTYLEQEPGENQPKDLSLVAIPRFNTVQLEGRDSETTVLELSVFQAKIDE